MAINWDNIQWKLQDVVLATELGCTRERVRQMRRLKLIEAVMKALGLSREVVAQRFLGKQVRGKPEVVRVVKEVRAQFLAETHHKRRVTAEKQIAELDTTNMTAEQVARYVGCNESYVRQILDDLGKPHKKIDLRNRGKYRWHTLTPTDWEKLSNKEIARKLKITNVDVVAQRRCRMKEREKAKQFLCVRT